MICAYVNEYVILHYSTCTNVCFFMSGARAYVNTSTVSTTDLYLSN